MTYLLRMPDVMSRLGLKKSAIYNMVNEGTLTSPVKMGKKTSLWPDYEVQAVVEAIIEEKDKEEMKILVKDLMDSRSKVSRL